MKTVVDYGVSAPRTPPQTHSFGTPAENRRSGAKAEPVIIVHVGSSDPEDAKSRNPFALGDRLAAAPGRTAGPTGTGEREGIPVPGTDYRIVSAEDAAERDAEVRSHERSHLLALGPYAASGVMLKTERGPEGDSYATGGSIKADLTEVPGDPRATLRKARAVQRAALSPGSPSAADFRTAAAAYRLAQTARQELTSEKIDTRA